jgi:hypothetical protein
MPGLQRKKELPQQIQPIDQLKKERLGAILPAPPLRHLLALGFNLILS